MWYLGLSADLFVEFCLHHRVIFCNLGKLISQAFLIASWWPIQIIHDYLDCLAVVIRVAIGQGKLFGNRARTLAIFLAEGIEVWGLLWELAELLARSKWRLSVLNSHGRHLWTGTDFERVEILMFAFSAHVFHEFIDRGVVIDLLRAGMLRFRLIVVVILFLKMPELFLGLF